MIQLTGIYLVFTLLLAFVDALRIKIVWGKKGNIDHHISALMGLIAAFLSIFAGAFLIDHLTPGAAIKWAILYNLFGWAICALIRLSEYNVFLNFFRILMKTNPTGRIDYVSPTTTSETDNFKWWKKIPFWRQRAIAVAGWAVLTFLYYKI